MSWKLFVNLVFHLAISFLQKEPLFPTDREEKFFLTFLFGEKNVKTYDRSMTKTLKQIQQIRTKYRIGARKRWIPASLYKMLWISDRTQGEGGQTSAAFIPYEKICVIKILLFSHKSCLCQDVHVIRNLSKDDSFNLSLGRRPALWNAIQGRISFECGLGNETRPARVKAIGSCQLTSVNKCLKSNPSNTQIYNFFKTKSKQISAEVLFILDFPRLVIYLRTL